MAWIEVHQSLPTHKKLKKFKRALGLKTTSEALGKLVMLWLWALDNAPDGNLSDIFPDDIAEAADARSGEEIIDALKSAGFLDENMQLHDWCDYAGTLITQRENRKAANRIRQQRCRENKCHAHVTRDNGVTSRVTQCDSHSDSEDVSRVTQCDSHGSTVPNRTPPYQTVPDHLSLQTPHGFVENGETEREKTPTVTEVEEAAKRCGIEVDAVRFLGDCERMNWLDSYGRPIRDWQTYMKGWAARDRAARTANSFQKPTPTSMQYAQRDYGHSLESIGFAFMEDNEPEGGHEEAGEE